MNFIHSLRPALLAKLGVIQTEKSQQTENCDASNRDYSVRDVVAEEKTIGASMAQENEVDQREEHSARVIRGFLGPATPSLAPSHSTTDKDSQHVSELPPSEYKLLASQNKSRWILSSSSLKSNSRLRLSRLSWLIILAFIMISLITILTTVLVLTTHHRAAAQSNNLTVDLGYSTYTGFSSTGTKIAKWLGIRYAAPPVGNLRFRAPQAPHTNSNVQQANKPGAICLSTPSTSIPSGYSEDCLFLDVYAPANTSKTHPVYVFIQGGGLVSDANPNLDGTSLIEAADHDMIVVTFNYRVGPYGFLASKEVKADGDLNAGLYDQRAVLKWVQDYIHLFGGDPNRVTIGGSSAGGGSVTLHLTAYGGRDDGLFSQAAGESSSFGTQNTVEESQYIYDGLVSRVGCASADDTLQCLRDVDISVIAAHNSALPTKGGGGGTPLFAYSDVIDGDLIPDYTFNLFASGRFLKIPTIFGAVTNDGTIFTPKNTNNYADVNNFLKDQFPKLTASDLANIDHLFPKAESYAGAGPYWRTAANAYGDMRYMCPGIWLSTIYAQNEVSGWNYHWDVAPQSNIVDGIGVKHVDEMNSIWGSATEEPEVLLNPMIQAYWTSFIRTGNPNRLKLDSAPEWWKMEKTGLQRIHFVDDPSNVAVESVPDAFYSRCNYLTGIAASIAQ